MVDQHIEAHSDAKQPDRQKPQREKEIEAQRIAMQSRTASTLNVKSYKKEQESIQSQQDEAERKRQANIRADNEAAERVATERPHVFRAVGRTPRTRKQQANHANATAEAAEAKIKQQEAIQAVKKPGRTETQDI